MGPYSSRETIVSAPGGERKRKTDLFIKKERASNDQSRYL